MDDQPYASPDSTGNPESGQSGSGWSPLQWLGCLVVAGVVVVLVVALMLPVTRSAGPAARRTQCKNNLKQIALALHLYHDQWNRFPPAYTVDADGRPLHSWRTLILPYLDQRRLYETIDLSIPWDDPSNQTAYETKVLAYRCPSIDIADAQTTYMAIVSPESCLRPVESSPLSEITDDAGKTMMVIEVNSSQAVHWMSPLDADEAMVLGLGQTGELPHANVLHAVFVDGSVQPLLADVPAAERRAAISIAGDDP